METQKQTLLDKETRRNMKDMLENYSRQYFTSRQWPKPISWPQLLPLTFTLEEVKTLTVSIRLFILFNFSQKLLEGNVLGRIDY